MAMGGAAPDSLSADQINIIVEKVGESSLSRLKDSCRHHHWLTGDILQNITTVKSLFIELNSFGFLKMYNLKLLLVETLGRHDINLDMIFSKMSSDAGDSQWKKVEVSNSPLKSWLIECHLSSYQDRGQVNGHQPRPIPELDSGFATSSYQCESRKTPAENDTSLEHITDSQNGDLSHAMQFKALVLVEMGTQKKEIDELRKEFRMGIQSLRNEVEKYQSDKQELLKELEKQKGESQKQVKSLLNEVDKLREENSDLRRKLEVEKADDEFIKKELRQKIEELQCEVDMLKKQKDGSEEQKFDRQMAIKKWQEKFDAVKKENTRLKEEIGKLEAEKNEDEGTKVRKLDDQLYKTQVELVTAEEQKRIAEENLERLQCTKRNCKTVTSKEQEEGCCREDNSGNSTGTSAPS